MMAVLLLSHPFIPVTVPCDQQFNVSQGNDNLTDIRPKALEQNTSGRNFSTTFCAFFFQHWEEVAEILDDKPTSALSVRLRIQVSVTASLVRFGVGQMSEILCYWTGAKI